MDTRPIGVFDSGIGGLTAVKEIINTMPNEDIVYFGDTARVPYGSKSRETIIKYAKQDLEFLLSKNVKAILIACGTVSATSIDILRSMTSIPILGVVAPVSKDVASNNEILVLATKASIASHAFFDEIHFHNKNANVYEQACPLFVPLIENGYISRDNMITKLVVKEYISSYIDKNINAVVLGCTHYPLIKDIIQDEFPNAKILEAGKVAVSDLKALLKTLNIENTNSHIGKRIYYASEMTEQFKITCSMFLGEPIDSVLLNELL